MGKVFISWSGSSSKAVASALRQWLPDVLLDIDVWMSEHDLDAGSRWSEGLNTRLEESNFGVICLTPENQDSPWLLFEAGALGKSTSISKVIPYLFRLQPTDVRFPLAQFQGVETTKNGTRELVGSISDSFGLDISKERLDRIFHKWWPDLEEKLSKVSEAKEAVINERTDREMIEEILRHVRLFSRSGKDLENEIQRTVSDKLHFKMVLPNGEIADIGEPIYYHDGPTVQYLGTFAGRNSQGIHIDHQDDGRYVVPTDDARFAELTMIPF